jgi:uncharacterized protein YkwD
MSNFQEYLINTALDAHNKLREQHRLPPLKHNPDLSKTALKWVEYLANNNKFEHSKPDQRKYKDSGMGENLYMSSGSHRPDKVNGKMYLKT